MYSRSSSLLYRQAPYHESMFVEKEKWNQWISLIHKVVTLAFDKIIIPVILHFRWQRRFN